jgi:hypothetical protein
MLCSKNVNALCQNEATEILCVRALGGEWETYPRCAEHPAAWDVKMIKRFSASAVTVIVAAGVGDGRLCASCEEPGWVLCPAGYCPDCCDGCEHNHEPVDAEAGR